MVLDMVERAPAIALERTGALDTPARLFRARCREWAHLPALRWKERGIWRTASWAEYYVRAREVGLILADLGCGRGDVVAILSENRTEWAYAEFGALCIGCAVAAIHPDASAAEAARVLADCGARLVFVETVLQLDKVRGIDGVAVVLLDSRRAQDADRNGATAFADLRAATVSDARAGMFERAIDEGRADDAALVGVIESQFGTSPLVLSNGELMAKAASLSAAIAPLPQSRNLAFFTFSDPGARIAGLHLQLARATIVHFPERPDTVLNDIAEVQPHLLYAPPRFWEKLHARVELSMRAAIRPARTLYRRACLAGGIAGRLVFPRLRTSLGLAHLHFALGAAAMPPDLVRWLGRLGVNLIEANALVGQDRGDTVPGNDLAPIEGRLRLSPVIADLVLLQGGNCFACVLLLDRDGAVALAQEHQITYSDFRDLTAAPRFVELVRAELDRHGAQIPQRIGSFRMLTEIEAGEERGMTSHQRINRRHFVRHYASLIEELTKEDMG